MPLEALFRCYRRLSSQDEELRSAIEETRKVSERRSQLGDRVTSLARGTREAMGGNHLLVEAEHMRFLLRGE